MPRVRNILFMLSMAAVMLACGLGGVPAAQGNNVATIVASTMQALTLATPVANANATATAPALQGIPVSYKNVSFSLPVGLATDAAPLTQPASTDLTGGPWDAGPEHIEFRLDGYNVPANSFSITQISVYPAKEYADVNAGANISLQRLKGLLANPSLPLENKVLPQVPAFNAASMFAAQVQRIQFGSGKGVRFLTQYGQAVGPVANNGMFYHFQGLTDDGKYYVIAILPVQAPFLENGNDPNAGVPAGGIPFPGYNSTDSSSYENYFKAVTDKLNSTDSAVFQPSLATLDALVQSITVTP